MMEGPWIMGVPLLCVVLQVACWRGYTLRGEYLREVKQYVLSTASTIRSRV